MTGGEDEAQQVVVDVVGARRLGRRHVLEGPTHLGQLAGVGVPAPDEVDGPVLGRGHEPGARIVRDT